MSHRILCALAALLLVVSYARSAEIVYATEEMSPNVVHIVVAQDLDEYLNDENYDNTPFEQELDIERSFSPLQSQRNLSSLGLDTLPMEMVADLDFEQSYSDALKEMSATNMIADGDLRTTRTTTRYAIIESRDGQRFRFAKPPQGIVEKLDLESADSLSDTVAQGNSMEWLYSDSLTGELDGPMPLTEMAIAQRYLENPPIPQIIAATPRRSVSGNSTSTAGVLWILPVFLGALGCWHGYRKYRKEQRELAAQSDIVMTAMEESQVEAEITEKQSTEEQSSETLEEALVAEESCDLELAALEDANALIANVNAFRDERNGTKPTANEAQDQNEVSADSKRMEDLTQIRGIGVKTQKALREVGICTMEDLASKELDELKAILSKTPNRFRSAKPKNWLEQARSLCGSMAEA